MTGNISW